MMGHHDNKNNDDELCAFCLEPMDSSIVEFVENIGCHRFHVQCLSTYIDYQLDHLHQRTMSLSSEVASVVHSAGTSVVHSVTPPVVHSVGPPAGPSAFLCPLCRSPIPMSIITHRCRPTYLRHLNHLMNINKDEETHHEHHEHLDLDMIRAWVSMLLSFGCCLGFCIGAC